MEPRSLAGPLQFTALRSVHETLFGNTAIGLLPIGLGAVSLGVAASSTRIFEKTDPTRMRALVWFSAVALCFLEPGGGE